MSDYVDTQNEREANAIKLVENLTDYVNSFNFDDKAFVGAFKSSHRTLQQSAFRLFLKLMEEMASDDYKTDLRNQNSKEIAQTLLKGFKLVKKQEYLASGYSEDDAEKYASAHNPSEFLRHV